MPQDNKELFYASRTPKVGDRFNPYHYMYSDVYEGQLNTPDGLIDIHIFHYPDGTPEEPEQEPELRVQQTFTALSLTRARLGEIYQKTDGKCTYCHRDLDPFEDWHVDHIIPKCQGGKNEMDNLTPACASCNLKKNGRTPEQWRGGI
jgi:hypothetical protein